MPEIPQSDIDNIAKCLLAADEQAEYISGNMEREGVDADATKEFILLQHRNIRGKLGIQPPEPEE